MIVRAREIYAKSLGAPTWRALPLKERMLFYETDFYKNAAKAQDLSSQSRRSEERSQKEKDRRHIVEGIENIVGGPVWTGEDISIGSLGELLRLLQENIRHPVSTQGLSIAFTKVLGTEERTPWPEFSLCCEIVEKVPKVDKNRLVICLGNWYESQIVHPIVDFMAGTPKSGIKKEMKELNAKKAELDSYKSIVNSLPFSATQEIGAWQNEVNLINRKIRDLTRYQEVIKILKRKSAKTI